MTRGKTIQIYLPNGNPKGIKDCEITSDISRGILIPRNLLKEAKKIYDKKLNQTGIYFLFSDREEVGGFQTYIGEAETLFKRIKQHDNSKEDYWNVVVCFLSDKDNLNKAYVKFLENHCYNEAKRIGKTELKNSANPTQSSITKQEEALVLSFFDKLKVILGTLGYPIFEEIKKTIDSEERFCCKGKDAEATGNLTEEGFIVYSGSKANLEESSSAGPWVTNMRNKLKEEKVIRQEGNIFVFDKDYEFGSPSSAATAVLARRANGWTEWKNKQGKTLDELKRQVDELK